MKRVDWIWLPTATEFDEEEFDFAWSELQRATRAGGVLFGPSWSVARGRQPVQAHQRVLCLRHARLSLERRCIARLDAQLDAGSHWVEACDSTFPAPMRSPDYATLRGMERYVSSHALASVPAHAGDCHALVALTSVAHLDALAGADPWTAEGRQRLLGAFVHDASGYFSGERLDVLPLVPASASRFLDVGGGEGAFLAALRTRRPDAHLTLVEQSPRAAAAARARGVIDSVDACPFLDIDLREGFDCVSFLDVLEHMAQPEAALRRARDLLSPTGVVLASLPNVGHWSVVADLLEGRWDEAPAGIHCVTHLRFFTLKSIEALFDRAGLRVEALERSVVPCPPQWQEAWVRSDGLEIDASSLETYAYLVRAVPRT